MLRPSFQVQPPGFNGWSLYWLIWFFVGFLGPELYAVFTNAYNTLSWQVWRLEWPITQWRFNHYAISVLVVGLAVFLTGHFVWGLFR